MRITLLTNGSRGDVQPFLALAAGLKKAGFEATLAAPPGFERFTRDYEVGFAALDDQAEAGTIQPTNKIKRIVNKAAMVERVSERAFEICQQSDAIIYRGGSYLTFTAHSIARKLTIPCFEGSLLPLVPTTQYPNIYISNRPDLPGRVNWLCHILFRRLSWQAFRVPVNRFRRNRLGMEPLSWFPGEVYRHPSLHGFSEKILPKPKDWPQNAHITGYWVLESSPDWSAPQDLVEFLENGPSPVYLGFGSMENQQPAVFWTAVLEALQAKGLRAVLAVNPEMAAAVGGRSKWCFPLQEAPHEWIFPKMAAVVHHGGAGTTGASFRAGVPAVILPHKYDQPFWGHLVQKLGAGPEAIPIREISVERLIAAIDLCLGDILLRKRAAEIGRSLQAENGVEIAVSRIQHYLNQ